MHVTDCIERALGGVARGDMSPLENFEFRLSEIAFGAVLG